MTNTFDGCSGLTSLNVANWNVSKVISFSKAFQNCSALSSLDLSTWATSTSVNNIGYMFNGCTNLTSLDLRGVNTSNVATMTSTFQNCSNIQTIYVSNLWSTAKVNSSGSNNMFNGCSLIVGGNGTVYNSSEITATYACIDTALTPGYFTQAI